MASLIPNILSRDPYSQIIVVGVSLILIIGIIFAVNFRSAKSSKDEPSAWSSFVRFFYACFLKPHEADSSAGQQAALESFYKAQADVYDATRKTLLCGREDMLGLAAAQLVQRAARGRTNDSKRIWVDVRTQSLSARRSNILKIWNTGWWRDRLQYRGNVCLSLRSRLFLECLPCRPLPLPM